MTNVAHHRGWTSKLCLRVARVVLAQAVVLVLVVIANPSAQAQTFNVLHAFGRSPDGAYPTASLLWGDAGTVYGTSSSGGTSSYGTIFEVSYGIGTVLHSFTSSDGAAPTAGLARDRKGNLYGTATQGGSVGAVGTVFKLDTMGTLTVLHNFTGGSSDGSQPYGGVVLDKSGNLYGTTYYGGGTGCGGGGCGTVFKLDTGGKETLLYSFTGGSDGGAPSYYAGLLIDTAGNLYGVTEYGGTGKCNDGTGIGCGVVFRLDTSGTETVLHNFAGGTTDGCYPYGNLVMDSAGTLYGTTSFCGASGYGNVFKVTQSGQETILHSFAGGATDGATPFGGVIRDIQGNLYGATTAGGSSGSGTVFKLSSGGALSVLHSFSGSSDGAYPVGGLLRDSSGSLYGTTEARGASGYGTVWKITK